MTPTVDARVDAVSRSIRASAHEVYRAFLDPKQLEHWLAPEGMEWRVEHIDPRPGGRYRMTLTYMTPRHTPGKSSDRTDVVQGQYVEIVPDSRVVQLVEFESEDPAFSGRMKMSWFVTPSPSGSEVSIVCEDVPSGISKRDHLTGLRSSLANLAKLLEK